MQGSVDAESGDCLIAGALIRQREPNPQVMTADGRGSDVHRVAKIETARRGFRGGPVDAMRARAVRTRFSTRSREQTQGRNRNGSEHHESAGEYDAPQSRIVHR